ncbi:DUF7144 family membrane protein [Microbacterium sp.]|uniref:DUF7144 family membrane protein n=1 Tax=Microbacterium sp. TaxID=51671 RepID=UPI002E30CEC5|nr:hypothetical protein [Microbacterium sp.]HEX5729650.1 hypothetical protein [Microbacterium sp.]
MGGAAVLIAAQPWWSLVMIAMDVLIIYALIVHGGELRDDGVAARPAQASAQSTRRR